jgi:hypothetical protein
MNPIALSAFTNNYIWMFHDGTHAVVLAAILVTHDLADHVGGARTGERIQSDRAEDALPMRLSSTDRERRTGSFSRCDATSVAQAARSHGAASLRQWKNDFR